MAFRKDASRKRTPPRRLGRGLDSLVSVAMPLERLPEPGSPTPLADPETPPRGPDPAGELRANSGVDRPTIRLLDLDQLAPNPRQPRQSFDEQGIQRLAASIQSAGVMQPVVARPDRNGVPDRYELVVGERRWRAARLAGVDRIPTLIRDMDDQTAAEWSLVENLQREDLNPIDRAEAFGRLVDDFGLTHQAIADRVGLERSSVTNHLRLTELDEFTKAATRSGQLGMGHARALLAITNFSQRATLARQAIHQDWSVREVERRVKSANRGAPAATGQPSRDLHLDDLERRLSEHLGTRVRIQPGRKKGTGKVTIEFYTADQFEGLLERMGFACS